MSARVDVVIAGAGPVGLMCAWLAHLSGMTAVIVDPSAGPLEVGRADALNARTLQLLEVAGLFDELYPLGKPCNTSSVWSGGKFLSRQSAWWDELEGCLHPHFLMLGQSHVEKLLDRRLREARTPVRRETRVGNIELLPDGGCLTTLTTGEPIHSRFVIGADGSRSFVRGHFGIPFEIERPQIVWAVIDAVVETDFPKVPEIIVFQADTSDVAWIPREGRIDRFYVRMDTKEFTLEDTLARINRAMAPHRLRFREVEWFSRFSVKESVAERFSVADRVFLAGDSAHIHSVNGGQGLNTGLADAFNLMWKLARARGPAAPDAATLALLRTYDAERRPVARSVVETSGELVRSTRDSPTGTHAEDYVRIVQKRAGNITGMGIRYGTGGLAGQRLHDFELTHEGRKTRLYSLLDYSRHTLLVFGGGADVSEREAAVEAATPDLPADTRVLRIDSPAPYPAGQALLVRPDSYIGAVVPLDA